MGKDSKNPRKMSKKKEAKAAKAKEERKEEGERSLRFFGCSSGDTKLHIYLYDHKVD